MIQTSLCSCFLTYNHTHAPGLVVVSGFDPKKLTTSGWSGLLLISAEVSGHRFGGTA
jgi:hypothetical protein